MTDEISTQTTDLKKPRSCKKIVAMIAAGALVLAGGITVVSISAANASAKEVSQLCSAALSNSKSSAQDAVASGDKADKALATVKSTALPKDAGTSTAYEARPAVAITTSTAARVSSADLIGNVTTARTALAGITVPTQCADRDQAGAIQDASTQTTAASRTLDASVTALLADFTVFQTDETKRIAAEKAQATAEAERKAAEQAAADEAARVAAAEADAAAASAAQQQQQPSAPNYGGATSGGQVYQGPAPYVPAPYVPAPYVPAPAPPVQVPPRGGGGVVSGGSNGVCHLPNGMGGTTTIPGPCP